MSLSGAKTTEPGIFYAMSVPELHDYQQQTTSFDALTSLRATDTQADRLAGRRRGRDAWLAARTRQRSRRAHRRAGISPVRAKLVKDWLM